MIAIAFSRAFSQLTDPAFRLVLLRGLAITLGLFIALFFGVDYLLGSLQLSDTGWLNTLVQVLGNIVFVVVLLVLFPAVSTAVMALFLEDVAAAVEKRYYPGDPPGHSAPFVPSLTMALRFLVIMVLLNLLVLLLTPFMLGINFFVYYLLNSYLLSREYFELVSLRHLEPKAIETLRKANSGRLMLAGFGIAVLMTVPLLNLVAPLLATAVMVHMFKGLEARPTT